MFAAIVHALRELLRLAAGRTEQPLTVIFDSRTLQSTPESGTRVGYEGAKRKRGSKVHLAVDTLGHLLALHVTPANEQDRSEVSPLAAQVQEVTGEAVEIASVAQAYTGEQAAQDAEAHRRQREVVKLPEAKKGFVLLPRRWVVERSFAWAGRFRRLARDYEQLADSWGCVWSQPPIRRCWRRAMASVRGKHTLRHQVLERAWQVDQATTKRQCAQRLRRLAEWTPTHLSGAVAAMVLKMYRRRADFTPAYDCPQAHRTSYAVDRLRNYQDRLLDAMRSCHATTASARLAVRAMALQWDFHPYGARLRRDQPSRVSPFHDLNGLQYHPNWLPNLLIAFSMGGLKL